MSLYNSIEKIKYTESLSDAVALDEYIVFSNERNELKFIVFKFFNNVNQKLLGMKFEVSQYDMHDNLIERSVVIYNNFNAKPNSSFVPKAKLRVLYACKRISVRLMQAAFDRVMWNEGEFVDNTYKFEHFARDEKYIEESERPKAASEQKPATKQEREEQDSRFTSKNVIRKNVAVFPKVFYCITSILLIVAIAITIWLFPKSSKRFTINGYDLELIADKSVTIIGYEGDEEALVVPAQIGDYNVVRIGADAFAHLSVVTISLPESVVAIEANAFHDLARLQTVVCSSESLSVNAKAFNGITSLTMFDMEGARLSKNCFYGCSHLSKITFSSTSVARFVDLFGETSHAVTVQNFTGEHSTNDKFFEGVKVAG